MTTFQVHELSHHVSVNTMGSKTCDCPRISSSSCLFPILHTLVYRHFVEALDCLNIPVGVQTDALWNCLMVTSVAAFVWSDIFHRVFPLWNPTNLSLFSSQWSISEAYCASFSLLPTLMFIALHNLGVVTLCEQALWNEVLPKRGSLFHW